MKSRASLSLVSPHPHVVYGPGGGAQSGAGPLLLGNELTFGVPALSLVGLCGSFKAEFWEITCIINVWKNTNLFFEHLSEELVLELGF